MSWEQRMAERVREQERQADIRNAGPMPTEPPYCCAKWVIDGPHGWSQELTCNYNHTSGPDRCNHEHHKDEVWIASAA